MSEKALSRREAELATTSVFNDLAKVIYVSDDFSLIYKAIVDAAPHLVDGCDHASLLLRKNGKLVTAASSDEIGALIDEMERELGEGPCVDALRDQDIYHDADLTDGSPWPRLTHRVLTETPVRSMAGFAIRSDQEGNGALNLFCDAAGGLTERGVEQGIVLAAFVSVALVAAEERRSAETLRSGLHSNREIGKAVGLMMAFHKIDDDAAFAMLRRTSQDLNVKLVEVARQIVAHHNEV